jgi:hypothetical protein
MTENETTPAFALSGYAVRVARLNDDDDDKRFAVAISRVSMPERALPARRPITWSHG